MTQIGTFSRDEDGVGFIGHLTTLLFIQDIIIVATQASDAENAPDYRVHIFDGMSNEAGTKIGAGWNRTGEKPGDYVAIEIDDPSFGQPIRADLFRDNDTGTSWSLRWNRPAERGAED